MTATHIGSDAGFTLLELMVTLALLGLLSLALLGSSRFGVMIWSRTESALRGASELRNAEAVLLLKVAQAYPKFLDSGASDAHIYFEGSARGLAFLAPYDGIPGALAYTRILLEDDGRDSALVSTETPELGGRGRTSTLLHHVNSLVVAYFGSTDEKSPAAWHSRWHDETRLPRLIRFNITFADAPATSFTAAPRLSADVGCVFDPLTKTCRGR